MKFKTLLILASLLMLAGGTAFGQSGVITLDAVDTISTGIVDTGAVIKFRIRLNNNSGVNALAITNGFRIYSPNGATWDTTTGTTTGTITGSMFENLIFINPFSEDGAGEDTIGFGGFSIFASGIPNGFDDSVWTIIVGPIPGADVGKQICLDSSFYRPSGTWLWSTSAGNKNPTWDGPHCFTIVSGGGGDQPPVQDTIGAQAGTECDTISFQVTATDPQSYVLTMTAVNLPGGATYTDNSNGTADFSWITSSGDASAPNVTFITTAATSNMADTEFVVITISANAPPVLAAIDSQTVTQCAQLVINISATDADGDVMTIDTVNGPTGGTFTDNGTGTATYTWTPGATNTDTSLMIIVSDDCGASDTETVAIKVNPFSAPVFAAMADDTIPECVTLSLRVSASNTQTLSDSGIVGGVFVDSGNGVGSFVWTPPNNASTDTVVFTASSSCGSDVTDTVIIAVTANAPPVLTAIGAQNATECVALVIPLSATDAEGATLTFDTANAPTSGVVFVDSGNGKGSFTWTAPQGAADPTVTFSVTDDCGNTVSEVVVITVGANANPVLTTIGAQNATECVALVIPLLATDAEGATLTFDTANAPTSGVVFVDSGNGKGSFTWTPPKGASSPTVTFRVSDDCGNTVSEIVVITVGVNTAPVLATITAKSVTECVALSFGMTSTDTDADSLTYSAVDLPAGATLSDSGNGAASVSWTPANGDTTVTVSFIVTDDCNNSDTEIVVITVNPNAAPVLAAIGAKNVDECSTLSFGLTSTDAEGGMTYDTSDVPAGATFVDSTGGAASFVWTPVNGDTTTIVTFIINDNCGNSDTVLVTITVNNNATPVWDTVGTSATVSLTQLETVTADLFATDSNSSTITIWVDTAASGLTGEDFSVDNIGVDSVRFTWRTTVSTQAIQHNISFIVSDGCTNDTLMLTYDIALGVAAVSGAGVPDHFFLSQNYPNPFNPETQIEFGIAEQTHVKLAIYNVLGQQIRSLIDESLAPNRYIADWDGNSDAGVSVATGIYFYRIETTLFQQTMKMVLMK